jgi:calcineurin-like phosphoesterase family protein
LTSLFNGASVLASSAEILFDDQTWLIADTHFFHDNIGRYCTRPDGWQDLIIANWNRLIQPGEAVFHLGDLALGKKENIETLVPLLNGTLYLMRGNHDRRAAAFYQSLGVSLVKDPFYLDHSFGLRLVFSHRPIVPLPPGLLNLHGHIHNNPTQGLGSCHVNLSIEMRQYRPWRLCDILQPYLGS